MKVLIEAENEVLQKEIFLLYQIWGGNSIGAKRSGVRFPLHPILYY